MKKKRVFIFGDSGFIGTHLKQYLLKKKNINLLNIRKKTKKEIISEIIIRKFWSGILKNLVYLSLINDLKNFLNKNLFKSVLPKFDTLFGLK